MVHGSHVKAIAVTFAEVRAGAQAIRMPAEVACYGDDAFDKQKFV